MALLLAGTRWGSYIGISPLFLTDILIALAVVDSVVGRKFYGKTKRLSGDRARPPVIFMVFFLYLLARGILSADYAFTITWVRDLVPFLYAGLTFLSAWSIVRASATAKAKTMRYLWTALIFHLAWTSIVVLGKLAEARFPQLPISGVHLFSVRPDIDMAVLAVTSGLLLRRLIMRQTKMWGLVALLLALVTAASLHSRAGLIALALVLGASYLMSFAASPKASGKRIAMVLAVPVLLSMGLAGFAQTTPGERMIATVLDTRTGTENELNAQGTERARQLTWAGVANWTVAEETRAIFGSGFGNDFLSEAGVLTYLEGTTYENVRSPHNWLVGVLARTGIIGVGLAVIVLAMLLAIIWRNRARGGADELLCVASLLVLAVIPVAMLGVVLEAPFGAVPFWWAAGIVFTMGKNRGGDDRPEDNHTYSTEPVLTTRC